MLLAGGRRLPAKLRSIPTAARLGWSWGSERLTPTAGQQRAPRRRPWSGILSAPLRSHDGKSWRRRRLPSRAERAPRLHGALGSPGTGCLRRRLLLGPSGLGDFCPSPRPRGRAPATSLPRSVRSLICGDQGEGPDCDPREPEHRTSTQAKPPTWSWRAKASQYRTGSRQGDSKRVFRLGALLWPRQQPEERRGEG